MPFYLLNSEEKNENGKLWRTTCRRKFFGTTEMAQGQGRNENK